MSELFASIDIGTNSALLLVAENRDGILSPFLQKATTPRVGRNLATTGIISNDAFAALESDLHDFIAILQLHNSQLLGVVATQAFRIAANGPELLAKVSEIVGTEAKIIAGPEESRLGYLAVVNRHPSSHLWVVDIGGGSTEVTRKANGVSFPIGAVSLLEACGYNAAACRNYAADFFKSQFSAWGQAPQLVCVGGTASAIAMLDQSLAQFNSEAIEGFTVTLESVSSWINRLANFTEVERSSLVGMEAGRRDILMPGLCILEALLIELKVTQLQTSDRGIRYGVILDALKNISLKPKGSLQ